MSKGSPIVPIRIPAKLLASIDAKVIGTAKIKGVYHTRSAFIIAAINALLRDGPPDYLDFARHHPQTRMSGATRTAKAPRFKRLPATKIVVSRQDRRRLKARGIYLPAWWKH